MTYDTQTFVLGEKIRQWDRWEPGYGQPGVKKTAEQFKGLCFKSMAEINLHLFEHTTPFCVCKWGCEQDSHGVNIKHTLLSTVWRKSVSLLPLCRDVVISLLVRHSAQKEQTQSVDFILPSLTATVFSMFDEILLYNTLHWYCKRRYSSVGTSNS